MTERLHQARKTDGAKTENCYLSSTHPLDSHWTLRPVRAIPAFRTLGSVWAIWTLSSFHATATFGTMGTPVVATVTSIHSTIAAVVTSWLNFFLNCSFRHSYGLCKDGRDAHARNPRGGQQRRDDSKLTH